MQFVFESTTFLILFFTQRDGKNNGVLPESYESIFAKLSDVCTVEFDSPYAAVD